MKFSKHMYPKIALIGRTNVGKSTLFNLLIEENKATVSPIPGTTRDLVYGTCTWRGAIFTFIDTGGIEAKIDFNELKEETFKRTKKALKEADLAVLLVDSKAGLTEEDKKAAKILKLSQKPYLFVANKADSIKQREKINELKKLGLGEPYFLSAASGSGTGDFLDSVVEKLKEMKLIITKESIEKAVKVAILGKPNVGKSALLNSLAGEERSIVSQIPHTTRDLIDIFVKHGDDNFLFIDTPGISKRSKIIKGMEKELMEKSLETAKKADIVLLVTDISDLTKQDKNLLDELRYQKAGMIIIANKMDLVKEKSSKMEKEITEYYHGFFPFLTWAPIHIVSAKTNQRTLKIFDLILEIYKNKFIEIPPKDLENLLKTIVKKRRPPKQKSGKSTFIYKIIQTKTNPLRFSVIMNEESLDPQYIRYIERMIREKLNLTGVSILVDIEKKKREK